jgi:hypothetical protein
MRLATISSRCFKTTLAVHQTRYVMSCVHSDHPSSFETKAIQVEYLSLQRCYRLTAVFAAGGAVAALLLLLLLLWQPRPYANASRELELALLFDITVRLHQRCMPTGYQQLSKQSWLLPPGWRWRTSSRLLAQSSSHSCNLSAKCKLLQHTWCLHRTSMWHQQQLERCSLSGWAETWSCRWRVSHMSNDIRVQAATNNAEH